MAVIDYSANSAHMAAVNASELQRQAATAAATLEDASEAYVTYAGVVYPDLPTAVRAIETAHYRRCYASAIANGVSISPYAAALSVLGTGPYG
jgi:hypothetical protein